MSGGVFWGVEVGRWGGTIEPVTIGIRKMKHFTKA